MMTIAQAYAQYAREVLPYEDEDLVDEAWLEAEDLYEAAKTAPDKMANAFESTSEERLLVRAIHWIEKTVDYMVTYDGFWLILDEPIPF